MPAQERKVPSKATGKLLSKVHEMELDDGDKDRGESHEVVYGVEGSVCVTTGHEGETAFLREKTPDPPDVAALASAHKLCDQNGAGTAAMPSARMNKEDYVLELRGLGEEVPSSWTIPEMKVRIQEIKEEQGMTLQSSGKKNTPCRVLAIEMNKCSKKKADLQEFTRTRLQMHVTGNETIAQLQKACLRKIYEITPPTPHDPTGFGVHSALSYEELFMTEPGYVKWVLQTASEGQADYRLLRLAKWLESRQVEPTKEVKKALNAKAQGARKQTAAAASVASDSSSKSNEALIQMIQSLQEEVAALREERPRKKTEKPDEQMTEGSFRVLSPWAPLSVRVRP